MGFLTGAFLKMYTTRMRIQLQHQLTTVTMRQNRITKQIGDMEKKITQMKQAATMGVSSSMQMSNAQAASIFQQAAAGADTNAMTTANVNYQNTLAMNAMNAQMSKSMIEQYYDQMSEAQLEPLKNMEEQLAMEKANLESRIKLIEGQEQASREMEKSSQKDFVPEYTGGG
ncbi:MAG: hypothetical protein KIC80_08355 [Brachyspira sp.]|jgi:hypothetical protein|nr:hypothetical protein [Brachyspira sp.]